MVNQVPAIPFVDAVQRLLASLGDPVDRDELVALSGVGLCFPWGAGAPCDDVAVVPEIVSRVLGTLGYRSDFFTVGRLPDWSPPGERADVPASRALPRASWLGAIERSLDAGHPVVASGLLEPGPSTCLVVGSDDDGLLVEGPDGEGPDGEVHHVADWAERCTGLLVAGERTGERPAGADAYRCITRWAHAFRNTEGRTLGEGAGLNWSAYPRMVAWLLDDAAWATGAQVAANQEWLWARGLDRLEAYRASLRSALRRLDAEHPGLVSPPALRELDALLGQVARARAAGLPAGDRAARERLAVVVGELRDRDASLQWALFMPGFVRAQTRGFTVEQHEYRALPEMRFVGVPLVPGEAEPAPERRRALLAPLDGLPASGSGVDHDLLLSHHGGAGVDEVPEPQRLLGRFYAAGTPVPSGFTHLDLVIDDDGVPGPPYLSSVAYATFAGPDAVVHASDGWDVDALYDTTRNLALGDAVMIPYPEKYWTAEVYLDDTGDDERWGYLFSVAALQANRDV
ncbi:hypothetical protein [Xylanimonas protaetiae]|uniref:Uncharacterized protein n=1 Tax=Xylanimonas protaetiae TaxID=2509457 RepID=A0A4V0YGD0_9MICO|nr:hypothetical protein [Xylanimonas protaetiae]QAY70781.1 hypothetical protein ET471_12745 [Xylanimonas protaetiae]